VRIRRRYTNGVERPSREERLGSLGWRGFIAVALSSRLN